MPAELRVSEKILLDPFSDQQLHMSQFYANAIIFKALLHGCILVCFLSHISETSYPPG